MLRGHWQVLGTQRTQPPGAGVLVRFAQRGATPDARATVGPQDDGHDYEHESELQDHSAARVDGSKV